MENNLGNATRKDKIFVVQEFFSANTIPEVTRIVYTDGRMFFGFFEDFDDEQELAQQDKFRFVEQGIKNEFYLDRVKNNGKPHPKYSIIIEAEKIADLRMISEMSGKEIQNPRYQNFLNRLHCVTNNFSI